MNGSKRKKFGSQTLTEDKVNVIQRLDLCELVTKIMLELGLGKSIVRNWKKNRSEIEVWCSSQASIFE